MASFVPSSVASYPSVGYASSSTLPPNSVWGVPSPDLPGGVAPSHLPPNSVWSSPSVSSSSPYPTGLSELTIPTEQITKTKQVARGTFGIVYEGSWQYTRVAIKELDNDLASEEEAEFNKETELMRRLRHPHVVMLYGVTRSPNSLVMEFLSGGTLYDKLKSPHPLDWPLRERLALDISKGLAYLHSMQMLHRDLKSNNILLDEQSRAKLADFGLSKIKMNSQCTGRYGHLRWAAPELISEAVDEFTPQCDIYSLGMIFWELASRKIPYPDLSDAKIFNRIVVRKEYGTLPPETSARLREAIQSTWQFDPTQRAPLEVVIRELEKGTPSHPSPSSSSAPSLVEGTNEFALGRLYENGEGVPQDLTQAINYYQLAAAKGHPEALKKMERFRRGEPLSAPTAPPPFPSYTPYGVLPAYAPYARAPSYAPYGGAFASPSPSPFGASSSSSISPVVVRAPAKPALAFGAAEWGRYFGDVGMEPPLPPNIDEILAMPCPFWPGKKFSETHLLTLIPAKVGGRPLTFNSLGELVQAPKSGGHATKYDYWEELKKQEVRKSVRESYWVLMTRDVLPGTRSKNYVDQKRLLEERVQRIRLLRGGVPTLLEAATSILMEHVRTGRMLYGDAPRTYTRCQEACWGYQIAVGAFTAAGLLIRSTPNPEICGLACSWKYQLAAAKGQPEALKKMERVKRGEPLSGPVALPPYPSYTPYGAPPIYPPYARAPSYAPYGGAFASPSPSPLGASSSSSISPVVVRAPAKPALAFGAAEWGRYFGDVGVEPRLPPNIDEILAMPCPFWPGKKLSETHLFTLIPATVDGRPLTLDSLGELIQAPKNGGHATKYHSYSDRLKRWDRLKRQEGLKSVRESFWVLMTRDVLPGTRDKHYVHQKRLLEEQVQRLRLLRGEVPTLLEAATSILMEHVRTGRRLYEDARYTNIQMVERRRWYGGDVLCTYTHCQDDQSVVGGFTAAGLEISYIDNDDEYCGLACSWKF